MSDLRLWYIVKTIRVHSDEAPLDDFDDAKGTTHTLKAGSLHRLKLSRTITQLLGKGFIRKPTKDELRSNPDAQKHLIFEAAFNASWKHQHPEETLANRSKSSHHRDAMGRNPKA